MVDKPSGKVGKIATEFGKLSFQHRYRYGLGLCTKEDSDLWLFNWKCFILPVIKANFVCMESLQKTVFPLFFFLNVVGTGYAQLEVYLDCGHVQSRLNNYP